MKSRAVRFGAGMMAATLVAALVLVCLAAQLPLPSGLERPASQVILDENERWLRVFITEDGGGMMRIPVSRDELPDHLVAAVLAFEDRRFHHHLGVDPLAMARAVWLNLSEGRVVSGGSTITMQVARMLEPRPRTVRSKLIEMFRAVQLELRFSKSEILTYYFNLAPYGGNIEGVGTASYFYYEKPVKQLSIDEAATLAAIPNSPNRYAPGRTADPRTRSRVRLKKRRNDVLSRMVEAGLLDEETAGSARSMPLHARRHSVPFEAPHLTTWLNQQYPADARVTTPLDADLQHRVERLLESHLETLRPKGITNGAVVVIENATRAVRAYVGSEDFFDTTHSGQVDGARAARSPGSTLKPFVYALSLERGHIGLSSLVEDTPLIFKDWSPSNFDGEFRGPVPARDALIASLNVPAVRLAHRLEPDGLLAFLARAQMSTFANSKRKYGLSAVLGGCEVTLLELTNLYATLAKAGLHQRYRVRHDEPSSEPLRLLSPASSYLIGEVLSEVERPHLSEVWKESTSIPRMAWKTGTSYGRRDAWSVGYNRRYSVGVWIGNFGGEGVPELVGARAAAPLLFEITRVLPGASTDPWISRPKEVEERLVCSLSGQRPGPDCPHRKTESFFVGKAPVSQCKLHKRFDIADATGVRLCSRCRHAHPHHSEVRVLWPADVEPWLEQAGIPHDKVPVHNPSCTMGLSGSGPTIHTPQDGDEFVLREGVPEDQQQIAVLGSVAGGAGPIYWFVDGALVSTTQSGDTLMLDPRPGRHRLVAVDTEGRRSAIRIKIHE